MTATSSALRLLEWDTAFFGLRIATLVPAPRDRDGVLAAIEAARAERIACAYVLSDLENRGGIQAIAAAGARLVDVRLTFDSGPLDVTAEVPRQLVRAAEPRDLIELRALAAVSHGSSRFYADGRFPRERCDEMFATWIERSCRGWADVVHVAQIEGRIRGYTTGHVRDGQRGEIGLVAVDQAAQGRGLGRALVTSVLAALRARGAASATVATQGMNIGAQRLYQSLGFRTQRVQSWHHLWLDEVRP